MRKNSAIIIVLMITILALVPMQFEVTLFDEVNLYGGPTARIHKEYITITGAVAIDSMYITRAKADLVGRELRVKLKGYKIPRSRAEGEYSFKVEINMYDFDTIVFVGDELDQRVEIY